MSIYRQGDVLVYTVSDEEAEKVRTTRQKIRERTSNRIVLAAGEKTGHAHVVDATRADEYPTNGDNGRYLDIPESAVIAHEEHAAVDLPKGMYRVLLQREYTPASTAETAEPPAQRHVID